MNKLDGFYKLKELNLPTVPWQAFKEDTVLDDALLWTIRCAVRQGNDFNLPRKVGVSAADARIFANELLKQFTFKDLVIYYPYFIAKKSGVIQLSSFQTVIEAVAGDLWNLVTDNKLDVTIIFEDDDLKFVGDDKFLTQAELLELVDYCLMLKKMMQQEISRGDTVYVEWSFAYESNVNKQPVGEKKLIFYEIRTV